MIHFTKEVDYGLLLIASLAELKNGQCISLNEISKKKKLPYRFLGKIVTPLKKAGIVDSEKGVNGGYRLTKPLDELRIADVLAAYDEDYAPVQCLRDKDKRKSCGRESICTTMPFWKELHSKMGEVIESYSIQDFFSRTQ